MENCSAIDPHLEAEGILFNSTSREFIIGEGFFGITNPSLHISDAGWHVSSTHAIKCFLSTVFLKNREFGFFLSSMNVTLKKAHAY